jgi:hypothetical protein
MLKAWKRLAAMLVGEPVVRFFIIGALLFLAHRLIAGDPRIIVVSRGVTADLERRLRDQNGRPPSASELGAAVRVWQRDEALYREALRDRLDRNDATIRAVLADRVRARAALGIAKPQPSGADLERWLATHRSLYETARRYDFGTVAFPRSRASSPVERERYQRALAQGVAPSALGRPIVGGALTAEDLGQRFGPDLAARIASLPVGQWRRLDSPDALLLVRVNAVEGGLPDADELRRRMVADWSFTEQQRAVDQAVQAIVDRYRFEVRP